MRRVRKVVLWIIAVAAVVAAVGWFGLQWYLNSPGGRRLASDKLTALLGLPVEVTSLRVGFGSTSVALVIPDPAADPPADFLRVGSIDTDISLAGLLSGSATPTRVTVRDADLVLRLDANRAVVSPLPKFAGGGGGKLPAVTVENARVRIRQPGKPEFDAAGVNATLSADGDGSAIRGDISDPTWGAWRIDGRLGADPADGHVTLTCDAAAVTDPLLRSIPFVQAKVWKHLSATGTTAAAVTLAFKPDGGFTYAVDLRPKGVTLTLPDADVTLTDVVGDVRIADGTVTADGGTLGLAGGRATVRNAVFDFDRAVYELTLGATASGVDVRRLPASWGLPKELEGKLKGQAELRILIADDQVDTQGNGTAEVENAKLAGLDAEIRLRLKGEKGRYRFVSMPGE